MTGFQLLGINLIWRTIETSGWLAALSAKHPDAINVPETRQKQHLPYLKNALKAK